ncbi:MAG: 4Fe-4S cluster-binding domain-containing protein [Thermoleophilia bacterium]|nr:4Fe-4S cluster-binding domain-containing protein [Thermoleophilia bacterium]
MALVQRQRVDRDEVFLEHTKSICPVCKAIIDAEVNIRDNAYSCANAVASNGQFEALVYSDAELYLRQQRFNKPGTLPLAFQTELKDGCPLDCGLCPEHKQHSCLGLIEVNSNCNLDCPICFADSGHQPDGYALTREQVAFMLDTFVAAEGDPEVIQFSGGEPTIHPQIVEFVASNRSGRCALCSAR